MEAGTRAHFGAVVRIRSADGSVGSGVLIDLRAQEKGLVLTAAHVAGGADTGSVQFASGTRCHYDLVGLDRIWDLAVLALDVPGGARHAVLAAREAYPRRGDPLSIAGYGSTGRLLVQTGQCLGYCRVGQSALHQTLVVGPAQARSGDSGGPIFNEQGEVVGIVWGASCRETLGSCTLRIWPVVERVLAERGADTGKGHPARTPDSDGGNAALDKQAPEAEGSKRTGRGAAGEQCNGCTCRCNQVCTEIHAQLARLVEAADECRRMAGERRESMQGAEQAAAELARLSAQVAQVDERLWQLEARLRGSVRFRLRWDPSTGDWAPVQP